MRFLLLIFYALAPATCTQQQFEEFTMPLSEQSIQLISAVKIIDTDRDLTVAVADDPDLILPFFVGVNYSIDGLIIVQTTGAVPGIRWSWNVPGGTVGDMNELFVEADSTFNAPVNFGTNISLAFERTRTMTDFIDHHIRVRGTFRNQAIGGNIAFEWAQDVSDAAITRVKRESYITLLRIG